MNITRELEEVLNRAAIYASEQHHEYLTPEHILLILTDTPLFREAYSQCGGDTEQLERKLKEYLKDNLDVLDEMPSEVSVSYGTQDILNRAMAKTAASGNEEVEISHLICSMFEQEENYGAYLLLDQGVDKPSLLYYLDNEGLGEEADQEVHKRPLDQYSICLNEKVTEMNPLIGREKEVERTMQVLCRRQKNNPLHIGEPGVGKTAITYGLVRRIQEGAVPDKLLGAKVYQIDMATLIAGTQFRGDFENRLKALMEDIEKEDNPIIYIDEIHNLVGAGSVAGNSMDASNLLKPYLMDGKIRFIGATTYEEYKKHFSKDKGLVRRFQNIDISEPSIEETVVILNGLKPYYESFHHVRYQNGTMELAAELSSKYINERYLPDKAIDLIDDAGAYLELHPKNKKVQIVDKRMIEDVLSKICNIPKQTVESGDKKKLSTLERTLKSHVFGQDEAVSQLCNAIKLSKSGLNDEDKPICSMLFVGPTGVGKTELARSAAKALGVVLVRFDMSEYAEKHTVAKLIGSPAGYVGYEEGGLLTEKVRKNPHCVLLLDEIEKAHSDIYNVLLQVMDYATLTDNQGRKADFRQVILIMTSNAGAVEAGKSAFGFTGKGLNEAGISDEIKRVFSPEFRNRLDRILIFRPLDHSMADRIVDKQFKLLAKKAARRQVNLELSKACREYLRKRGVSREYGAREITRLINQEIKPLMVDQMLFGDLKNGGDCQIDYNGSCFCLTVKTTG